MERSRKKPRRDSGRSNLPDTFFAPPERASTALLDEQIRLVSGHPLTAVLLLSLNGAAVILNRHRQIVAANDALLEQLGIDDPLRALGLRPGEAVRCVQVESAPNGCGTSRFCSTCGAVIAILAAQQRHHPVERECLVTRGKDGFTESLEFLVRASPLALEEESFLVFSLLDIREKKRAAALERVFLHDMLNYLQGLRGTCDLLSLERLRSDSALVDQVRQLSDHLTEATTAHRDLILMESNQYTPHVKPIQAAEIMSRVRDCTAFVPAAKDRTVAMTPVTGSPVIHTDRVLIVRVLVNMVKNALEASPKQGTVRVWYEHRGSEHLFRVWNDGRMDDTVALRVFQRYFSTKGEQGRGLGTYSMKLLGERYLGGAVRFHTGDDGTVFELSLPDRSSVVTS